MTANTVFFLALLSVFAWTLVGLKTGAVLSDMTGRVSEKQLQVIDCKILQLWLGLLVFEGS